MQEVIVLKRSVLFGLLAGAMVVLPALAEKPSWAGGEKGNGGKQHERQEKHAKPGHGKDESFGMDERGKGARGHFGDQNRAAIREYYAEQFRSGHCPPGLAKKHNNCMPPGQAKKWKIGYPLPREVIYYDLPPVVISQIGPPPSGHRYVRVAGDILLMAVGTGLIVDAIEDLSR